jgi:hypothetical protein
MSKSISKQIAHSRTLKDPNPGPGDRKESIQKNQWIEGLPAYETYDGFGLGLTRTSAAGEAGPRLSGSLQLMYDELSPSGNGAQGGGRGDPPGK